MEKLISHKTDLPALPISIGERIVEVDGVAKLSAYDDSPLSPETWAEGIAIIKKSFPKLNDDWYDEMTASVRELKFTNKRFIDAVKRMKNECKYPEPTIAEIIRHDKQVNLLTHEQVAKESQGFGGSIWAYYQIVDVEGKPFYVLKRDIDAYNLNLKKWESKSKEVKITGKYEDGKKVVQEKSFSIVDHYNEIVKKEGGTPIVKSKRDKTSQEKFRERFGR